VEGVGPRTVTAVDLADLPLARAVLDRAAELRADPEVLTRAIADPATRVLVVGGGELVVGDEGAALLDPATARRVAGSGDQAGDDERWLLLGRDGEGAHGPLVVARRVARGGPVPRTGQPSDVLVHRAAVRTPGDGPESPSVRSSPAASSGIPLAVSSGGADASPATSGSAGSPRSQATAASSRPPAVSSGGDGEPEPLPGLRWAHLRDVGATLSARDAGLATMAVALDAWHSRHPRCPRCGEPTVPGQGGWVRICRADGSEHYPRTDPAIIVAVVDDDDRLLLGHNAAWPEGRYSTLAGFVEAGESAEHAVRREVAEETGVVVDAVEYRGSQPWPFPASLMLAYRGHAATTELRVDGVEVTEARWLTRDELAAAVRAGGLLLPMGSSVAHALISDWFGAPLPTAP